MGTLPKLNRRMLPAYGILSISIVVTLLLVVSFFNQWPIEKSTLALDWRGVYRGVENGIISYDHAFGLFLTPWTAILLIPLGLLTMRAGWGVLSVVTLTSLLLSVPRTRNRLLYLISVVLLVISYPALRLLADGNFEVFIITGVILCVYSYRTQKPVILGLGVLLASAKVQETWILLGILALYVLLTWSRSLQLKVIATILVVVIPCLLWAGIAYVTAIFSINERNSIVDNSLTSTLTRLGLPSSLVILCWIGLLVATLWASLRGSRTLSREKAAMLVCASLLLAPYSAGNSFISVLAIGIIPLFQKNWRPAALIFFLIDILFFLPRPLLYDWSASYLTGLLLFTMAVLTFYDQRVQKKQLQRTAVPSAVT